MLEVIRKRFKEYGFPLEISEDVMPPDDTTLFCCAGMSRFKDRFKAADGGHAGTLQSCIRTNDLDEVGDGTHLTMFKMLGNFSFGRGDYEESVEMWTLLMRDLGIPISHVVIHPSQQQHRTMWEKHGFVIVEDEHNIWTDGEIGGYCCEMFCGDLEVGNLVNSCNGTSVDVGFGYERMQMLVEGKKRVDETSSFIQDIHPILADHHRTLECLFKNNIIPGGKGRNSICRQLLRRYINLGGSELESNFSVWIEPERQLIADKMQLARRQWRKFKDRTPEWWKETYGVDADELAMVRQEKGE